MPQRKPLTVLRKLAPAKPVGVKALPTIIRKPKLNDLSPRAAAAIKDIVENKTPVSTAMRKAGYSESSSRALVLKETRAYKMAVEPIVQELVEHRTEILKQMRATYHTAEYSELASALSSLTKDIQLLSGRATGRMGFELPEEEKQVIYEIMMVNSKKK